MSARDGKARYNLALAASGVLLGEMVGGLGDQV